MFALDLSKVKRRHRVWKHLLTVSQCNYAYVVVHEYAKTYIVNVHIRCLGVQNSVNQITSIWYFAKIKRPVNFTSKTIYK